jgi:hypothetical protein
MNFFNRLEELKALYGTKEETQKCYGDCVEVFINYMEQLRNQMERNIKASNHDS